MWGTARRRRPPVSELPTLDAFLAGASVASDVYRLRPDYRAMLVAVEGIIPSPSDDASDALLQAAEAAARKVLGGGAVEQIPHVAQWRQAYRAFGAKPTRTPKSLGGRPRGGTAG